MSKGILKKVLAVTVLAAGAAVAAVKLIERSGLRRSESKDGEEGFQSCEEGAVDRNYVPLSHEAAEESKEALRPPKPPRLRRPKPTRPKRLKRKLPRLTTRRADQNPCF